MKKIYAFMLVLILLLLCTGCAEENIDEFPYGVKLWGPNKCVTYRDFSNAEQVIDSCSHIFEGVVVNISAEVFNEKTVERQITPVAPGEEENYFVATVYTILVTQPYKGSVGVLEYMVSNAGNWMETVVQRKTAMERVGMYDPDVGVEAHSSNRKLEKNQTYLFCVMEWESGYMSETGLNLAFKPDWNISKEIKGQLPQQTPPLLILSIGIAVFVVVNVTFFTIRAKKKKKIEPEEMELTPEET